MNYSTGLHTKRTFRVSIGKILGQSVGSSTSVPPLHRKVHQVDALLDGPEGIGTEGIEISCHRCWYVLAPEKHS